MLVKIQVNDCFIISNNVDESKMNLSIVDSDGIVEGSVAVNIDDLKIAIRKLTAK